MFCSQPSRPPAARRQRQQQRYVRQMKGIAAKNRGGRNKQRRTRRQRKPCRAAEYRRTEEASRRIRRPAQARMAEQEPNIPGRAGAIQLYSNSTVPSSENALNARKAGRIAPQKICLNIGRQRGSHGATYMQICRAAWRRQAATRTLGRKRPSCRRQRRRVLPFSRAAALMPRLF